MMKGTVIRLILFSIILLGAIGDYLVTTTTVPTRKSNQLVYVHSTKRYATKTTTPYGSYTNDSFDENFTNEDR